MVQAMNESNSNWRWEGGDVVVDEEKRRPPLRYSDDELDREIARYESMPEALIDAELANAGIDIDEIVQAVHELVRTKLDEWRHRRILEHEPS